VPGDTAHLLARQNVFSNYLKVMVSQNLNWVVILKRMIKENLAIALTGFIYLTREVHVITWQSFWSAL